MSTGTVTIPTEETSSYKFLSYAFRFHRFIPKLLSNKLEETKCPGMVKQWFCNLKETPFSSLTEEDRDRLSLYWRYDEALLDGGYTLERLWRCHCADITLHDGTVLRKHPDGADELKAFMKNRLPRKARKTQREYDTVMRTLYVEDIEHTRRGGVLSDLHREYCSYRKVVVNTRGPGGVDAALMPYKENLRPRLSGSIIQQHIREERFHEYVNHMTGLSYAQLWPDARYLWGEFWNHDKALLEAGYSYERLKLAHMLPFYIVWDGSIPPRLKPCMLAKWNDHDDILKAWKAVRVGPSRTPNSFAQDIEMALFRPDGVSPRRDLNDSPWEATRTTRKASDASDSSKKRKRPK